MDIRLNSIKDQQGKITLDGTSSLTVAAYDTAVNVDHDQGKSSTDMEDDGDIDIHSDRQELLRDDTLTQDQQHLRQDSEQQQQQQQRWWQSAADHDTTDRNLTRWGIWKARCYRHTRQLIRHVRQLDRRQIMEYAIQYRWVLVFFILSFIMGAVMYVWRKDLLSALETLSNAVSNMGASGYLLMSFLIFLSAFPPMIGYGTFQSLSGFTFGFAKGYPISYFSALFGAVACFIISRRYLKKRVQSTMAKYPNLEAVVKAVEKKGFKLFVLIRLSPYPFNLLNVLFAATDIPLSHFALGTALSLIKIGLHVYIGANLTSFAKHVLGEEDDLTESEKRAETVREIVVVIGSILATAVMVYVYFVAKRAVEEVKQESDESQAFLGPMDDDGNGDRGYNDGNRIAMEEAGVTDDWIEWNESDEDDSMDNRPTRPGHSTGDDHFV